MAWEEVPSPDGTLTQTRVNMEQITIMTTESQSNSISFNKQFEVL